MTREKPDWFYLKARKRIDDLRRAVPTAEQTVAKRIKQFSSKYPLRSLGLTQDGPLWIAEEERENHLHILGTTGEGKSRFIEHLIREDIQRGNGVCLLDPTDGAESAYNILAFCQSIGFEKVCLIDPHTLHSHNIATIVQPFHYQKSYRSSTVANMMDTVRILFQTKDPSETPRIQRNLSALINVLWAAKMTMHEAVYFSEYKNSRPVRTAIMGHSPELDRHRMVIEELFETYPRFNGDFSSTVRRLEPFFDSTLDLMFGGKPGVDFMKMITEGWVILVNLYSGLGFEPIHTRLLGTTIINELIFALDRLKNRGWKGIYYLYIDEAGRYANRNLADLLAYKRKSGLRVAVAHQYFRQFEDPYVLDAIKQLCKIKVMFNTPGYADRLEMVKALGYGGDIPHELANYANKDLPKQQAVIKKGKESPVRVRIPDVKSINVTPTGRKEIVARYLQNEWNPTSEQIHHQFEQRIYAAPPSYPRPPTKRAASDGKTTSSTRNRAKTVFDID